MVMAEQDSFTCEVCGEPAKFVVQDILSKEDPKRGCLLAKPSGIMHYYCDKHVQEPKEIDITSIFLD